MFLILIVLMIAVLVGLGLYFSKGLKTENTWKWLPREKNFGMALLIPALAYGAFYGRYMLEGGLETYRPYIWIVLPIVAACCYFFLDYIFARSLGGVLLVLAIELLGEGFIVNLPLRFIFSTLVMVYGILGLTFIGMPWVFRNLLQKVNQSVVYRRNAIWFMGFSVVFFLLFLVLSFLA
ncbi:MAG: hypothetical protein KAG98_03085 [Lentisphaeria bacterium]|nr:hypothetical protein [Lentisphaeria bacterium]